MREQRMTLLIFALSFLHRRLCIEKSSRFRRLSLMPSRFVEKFATFGNVSLLVCTALGMKEDVLGINYQASSNVCELIRGTNGCIEYDSGDITGWQAFRRCDGEATGLSYKSVTQSSDHTSDYRPASRAVDGDYDTISHTANPPVDQPWWILELCYEATITGVQVWNRKDCCKENLSNLNITINDMFCGNITEPPGLGAKEDVMCPEPLNGKIVKIQKMAKRVSLLECTELGIDEGVLGINYQASSKVCELIKKTGGCTDYDSGDITGWQAFRRCGNGTIDSDYKSVSQSSEHASNYRPAPRAVDGDFNTISVTAQQPVVDQPWWMLELCHEATVTGLHVWNRRDCCKDHLSNLNITVNDMFCGQIINAPELGVKVDVMCPKPLNGKIVKIQKMAKSVLNIAEVRLIYTNDGC